MTARGSYPERQGKDHVRKLTETVVTLVAPKLGEAGVGLFNWYFPAALEQRRDAFFKLLDERLAEIEERVLNDEAFQTILIAATKAALGTHLEKKLSLLAAAVQSSADAVGRGDDEFMAMRFLRWVDELEPIHFEILGAIRDDQGRCARSVLWGDIFDRVSVEDDVWYQALEDLTSRRLMDTTAYNPNLPAADFPTEVISATNLGGQLVQFVQLMDNDG